MSRRAFTMLEMMLAVVVGGIVIAVAMSMFLALDRAQQRLERRFEASLGLGRIRLAVSRAMEQLLVANTERPAALDEPENLEQLLADGGASMGEGARPRFVLEPEEALPLMEWQPDPFAAPALMQPQRLELTLRSAPVYALAAGGDSLALGDAGALEDLVESMRQPDLNRRAGRREPEPDQEGAETDGEEGDEDADDPEALAAELREAPLAPGVRGVFEVTPEEQTETGQISWTLWWRVLGDSFETGALDAALRMQERVHLDTLMGDTLDYEKDGAMRVKLAEGLRTVRWTARRDGESMERLVVVWWRDLPAYVELETQTLDGRWNKWMFEVSWTEGPEPGTPLAAQPSTAQDGEEGSDQRQPNPLDQLPGEVREGLDGPANESGDEK